VATLERNRTLFIDGEFSEPADGGVIDVRDKATGEVFASVGLATAQDVDHAVQGALAAQRQWAQASYAARACCARPPRSSVRGQRRCVS